MSKIKILVVSPNPEDGTSFYRGHGPFTQFERDYDASFEIIYGPQASEFYAWPTMRQMDIVYFQRPALPIHAKIIHNAKLCGAKIWLDFDDDLLHLPKSHPSYATYSNPQVSSAIHSSLKMADLVSVSTPRLKESLGMKHIPVTVVPNAWDERMMKPKYSDYSKLNRAPIVSWRGNSTHQMDLMTFQKAIFQIDESLDQTSHNQSQKWRWEFFGWHPWFLTQHMEESRVRVHESKPIPDFFNHFLSTPASVLIVPLENTDFNHSKSNIAWIEGTIAGSAVVGPDWEEWKRPGLTNYSSPDDFAGKVTELIQDPALQKKLHAQSWEYVSTELRLSEVNRLRREAIDQILSLK